MNFRSSLFGAALGLWWLGAVAAPELGVYRWDAPRGPEQVEAFGQWLGESVTLAAAFEASDRWDNVDGAAWQLGPWSQWVHGQYGRKFILGVPMLPGSWDLAGPDGMRGTADDLSLAKCSAGAYDGYWVNLANELAYFGLHRAYLRLGWEMDGGWYAWRAQQDQGNEASFAGCFRRIVQVMRATLPGNQWKFVWNPTNNWRHRSYLDDAWPGDEYVDYVGIDLYDQSWMPDTYPYPANCDPACRLARQERAWNHYSWHLYTIRDFAAAKGKRMAIPEWGITTRADGHGGGENPYYIRKMHEFIMNPANHVAFHVYFDVGAPDGDHRISPPSQFPESAALFQSLFGRRSPGR